MKKLKIDLTNCHGIRRLTGELSFKDARATAIYAPNGMMKTSFARTFGDLSRGEPSTDHVFPDRVSSRSITDEDGLALDPEQVVVIVSYDEEMGPTEQTSTLLVDKVLRSEYADLQHGINEAKTELVTALKSQAQTKKDVSSELSLAITRDRESFFRALVRVEDELKDEAASYAELPYDVVFDDKVVALLQTKEFTAALAKYVARFNELLDASTYFSRETFSYYNAETIAKSLGTNGFFEANHSIMLHDGEAGAAITSQKELADLIASEKNAITDDPALRKTFGVIESKLTKNVESRRFWSFISEHQEILPELENVERFRERVWKSYLKANEALYTEAVSRFRDAEKRKREIQATAEEQRGQWEEVIEIFNRRFFVPFTLTAKNRTNVVLGLEPVTKLGFEFADGNDRIAVERDDLLEVLSTGEKKALYILNVLFEVERRKNSPGATVFIVDDIADSFDYKNKYAIIQYLKDIAEFENFRLVVLTHNFDFYRTLESRFVPYKQCLMAQKSGDGLELIKAAGIKNPFIKDFKPNFFSDATKRVAAIPFVRNLLEYTRGEDDPGYIKLTSLLHWKPDTASITQGELDQIFNDLFGVAGSWSDPSEVVVDMVNDEAQRCVGGAATMDLANKITLSIAIRIAAEKFMIASINDQEFIDGIRANQTAGLFTRYRRDFPSERNAIRTIDGVVLMTPEHIHVNSFMYEPILDMSDEHLVRLLNEVDALS
ncbi:UNVERIFIED_ORG: energy-coupling factor transporter ATP-binding protein EcfA2 [Paenarthrobacter nicotinovorans]